ncbi:MAG: hypothetical protein H8E12_06295 [Rhodobacteraceae bacterium]|nr:hypothetical protein [Paracoccaceae bacterium]
MSNLASLTVEVTDLVPYLDERPITHLGLEELGFKRYDLAPDESGEDETYVYYTLEIYPEEKYHDLALISNSGTKDEDITSVTLFPYDKPIFHTLGGIKTILMGLHGESL